MWARASPRPSAQHHPLSGQGQLLEQTPWWSSPGWLHSLCVCTLPNPALVPTSLTKAVLEQEQLEQVVGECHSVASSGPGPGQCCRPLPLCCLHKSQQWLPVLHSSAVSSLSQLCPPNYGLSLSDYRPCPNLELGPGAKVGQEWSKSGARVGMWFRLEISQESCAVLNFFLCLVSWINKCMHAFCEWFVGFLQPSCYFHWFLNQLRGLDFPVSDPRAEVPHTWLEVLSSLWGSPRLCNPPPLLWPLLGVTWPLLRPSCVILSGSYSQLLLYKSLSASLHFVFSENFSTCGCIF